MQEWNATSFPSSYGDQEHLLDLLLRLFDPEVASDVNRGSDEPGIGPLQQFGMVLMLVVLVFSSANLAYIIRFAGLLYVFVYRERRRSVHACLQQLELGTAEQRR